MTKLIINAIIHPFKAVWAFFDDDCHKIVSKEGQKVLTDKKAQIYNIHDIMNCCDDPDNRGFKNSENGISWYCKKCCKTLYSS